jgi:3-dehydroquinate dehydratase-2
MRIMIINGPNLNPLGIREPHIYGSTTLDAIKASCEEFAGFAGAELSFHQSNHEGVLVDLIQSARTEADALIINPAAYSFTSIAMVDALKIFEGPIFEVHISNIHARNELHRHSKLSAAVKAVIAGLGVRLHRCHAGRAAGSWTTAGGLAGGDAHWTQVAKARASEDDSLTRHWRGLGRMSRPGNDDLLCSDNVPAFQ